MTETRVAYGARCFWWGDIQTVGNRGGLPCCPTCGGMLFEMPDEATFLQQAQTHEDAGHPGYVAFITWSKGKCFPTLAAAQQAYATQART